MAKKTGVVAKGPSRYDVRHLLRTDSRNGSYAGSRDSMLNRVLPGRNSLLMAALHQGASDTSDPTQQNGSIQGDFESPFQSAVVRPSVFAKFFDPDLELKRQRSLDKLASGNISYYKKLNEKTESIIEIEKTPADEDNLGKKEKLIAKLKQEISQLVKAHVIIYDQLLELAKEEFKARKDEILNLGETLANDEQMQGLQNICKVIYALFVLKVLAERHEARCNFVLADNDGKEVLDSSNIDLSTFLTNLRYTGDMKDYSKVFVASSIGNLISSARVATQAEFKAFKDFLFSSVQKLRVSFDKYMSKCFRLKTTFKDLDDDLASGPSKTAIKAEEKDSQAPKKTAAKKTAKKTTKKS